jgi:hypothetical protein
MSRLLHAADRGARIDVWYQCKWVSAIAVRTVDDLYNYRIHPDDEHLQYGPISTALREMARQPKAIDHKGVNLPHFGFTIFAESENELLEVRRCDKLTHSLFLLILAEALADEGM